jgi:hypothetical protein
MLCKAYALVQKDTNINLTHGPHPFSVIPLWTPQAVRSDDSDGDDDDLLQKRLISKEVSNG